LSAASDAALDDEEEDAVAEGGGVGAVTSVAFRSSVA
jgi:hypothetical protein